MRGYNNKYGAYATKEDKKESLIIRGRQFVKALQSCADPKSHVAQAHLAECVRIERLLHTEHNMTEFEIWTALYN